MQENLAVEDDRDIDMHPEALQQSLQAAIAAEIRDVRTQVEQLADVLVADPQFAERFLDQLQAFDLIVQHIEESACLLDRLSRGTNTYAALQSVRLEGLRARLDRRVEVFSGELPKQAVR